MQRIGNLNWENITYDHDISGLVRGLTDWGVIEGGTVVGNKLQPVQAVVPLVRSNGQKILAFFESDEVIDLPTSGNFKVYIEVDQAKIDFGGNNTEDWSGIASIKTWPTLPSQNFLLLASVTSWVAKDERNLIPKVGQIAQRTTTLEEKVSQAEEKVGKLEEAGTPSYLGITGIVWEKYTMEDTLFLQKTPQLADSTIAINVGDIDVNKEQHIQRISSGVASNQLKLKMDKVLSPTSSVVVEVRKGIKVDVNEKEAYWYGGWEVLATVTLPYTKFSTEAQEITVDLNKSFQLPKGNLYSVVVKQQWGIVNANNYYRVYCDRTQWSEAFSAVAVNGDVKACSYMSVYCVSDAFADSLLAKNKEKEISISSKYDLSNAPIWWVWYWATVQKVLLYRPNIAKTFFVWNPRLTVNITWELYNQSSGYTNWDYSPRLTWPFNVPILLTSNPTWLATPQWSWWGELSGELNVDFNYYQYWNWYSRNDKNKLYANTVLTGKFMERNVDYFGYPIENKGIGEQVGCAMFWIFRWNKVNWIAPRIKIPLNKTTAWENVSSSWVAPYDWLLEVSWSCWGKNWELSSVSINWKWLSTTGSAGTWWYDVHSWYWFIFVPKGTVSISAHKHRYSDITPSITLISFISL